MPSVMPQTLSGHTNICTRQVSVPTVWNWLHKHRTFGQVFRGAPSCPLVISIGTNTKGQDKTRQNKVDIKGLLKFTLAVDMK